MVSDATNNYTNLHQNIYQFRTDNDSLKYISYGYELIKIINQIVDYPKIDIIRDDIYIDANHQRFVDYIVARILNIGYYYINIYDEKSTEFESKLLHKLKEFLIIDDIYINKLFILVKNICLNYEHTDPSQKIKDSIRKKAKQLSHNCYICGRELDADKQTERKKQEIKEKRNNNEYIGDLLEIEHILPRVFGGGINRENITVACEHCNKIKDDKLSYADCYFEEFIVNSDSEQAIKSKLSKDIKFSILYKQNFRCNECNQKLYDLDIQSIVFYKKEIDEPFHFSNLLMCCELCSESKKIEGVKNGLYI